MWIDNKDKPKESGYYWIHHQGRSLMKYETDEMVYDAYWSGKKTEDNPYNGVNEDHQWEAWKEGYYNASQDD